MAKKTRKKATAKKSKKATKSGRASAKRSRKSARAKHTKRTKTRRSKPPAKVASAFQIMIDTINETERLRAKNERRDVTDETG